MSNWHGSVLHINRQCSGVPYGDVPYGGVPRGFVLVYEDLILIEEPHDGYGYGLITYVFSNFEYVPAKYLENGKLLSHGESLLIWYEYNRRYLVMNEAGTAVFSYDPRILELS